MGENPQRMATSHSGHADDSPTLTPEQMAALKEFDRAVNTASEAEVLSLIVPAVLGPRCGGGLRLQGCSRQQLEALMDLKKLYERTLARDAARARRSTVDSDDP